MILHLGLGDSWQYLCTFLDISCIEARYGAKIHSRHRKAPIAKNYTTTWHAEVKNHDRGESISRRKGGMGRIPLPQYRFNFSPPPIRCVQDLTKYLRMWACLKTYFRDACSLVSLLQVPGTQMCSFSLFCGSRSQICWCVLLWIGISGYWLIWFARLSYYQQCISEAESLQVCTE